MPRMEDAMFRDYLTSIIVAAALTGLTGCGDAGTEAFDDYRVPIFADAFLHNASGDGIEIELQLLQPDAELDCNALAFDPGQLSSPGVLAPADTIFLPTDATAALRDMTLEHACYAAVVTPLGGDSYAIVWWADTLPEDWIDGEIADPQQLRPGAVSLEYLGGVYGYRPRGPVSLHQLE